MAIQQLIHLSCCHRFSHSCSLWFLHSQYNGRGQHGHDKRFGCINRVKSSSNNPGLDESQANRSTVNAGTFCGLCV
ncbi:hypothetical protein GN956_G19583 [Arapaima gigas]